MTSGEPLAEPPTGLCVRATAAGRSEKELRPASPITGKHQANDGLSADSLVTALDATYRQDRPGVGHDRIGLGEYEEVSQASVARS